MTAIFFAEGAQQAWAWEVMPCTRTPCPSRWEQALTQFLLSALVLKRGAKRAKGGELLLCTETSQTMWVLIEIISPAFYFSKVVSMIEVAFSCDYYYYCHADYSGQGLKVTCGLGTGNTGCVGGAGRWSPGLGMLLGSQLLAVLAPGWAIHSSGPRSVLSSTWWWCCRRSALLFRPRPPGSSVSLSITGGWIALCGPWVTQTTPLWDRPCQSERILRALHGPLLRRAVA